MRLRVLKFCLIVARVTLYALAGFWIIFAVGVARHYFSGGARAVDAYLEHLAGMNNPNLFTIDRSELAHQIYKAIIFWILVTWGLLEFKRLLAKTVKRLSAASTNKPTCRTDADAIPPKREGA
jgi:hypothetical protein